MHQQAERKKVPRSSWPKYDSLVGGVQVSLFLLSTPFSTHSHMARPRHARPSGLPVPVGRHLSHCPLVTAPLAQHKTTPNIATQRNATQRNTALRKTKQGKKTQHGTSQHNTSQHITSQHNKTQHNTKKKKQ